MRLKVQEPVQSLFRTEALSPAWMIGRKIFRFFAQILYLPNFEILFSLQVKMNIPIHLNRMRL